MTNSIDETDAGGIPAFLKRVATSEEIAATRKKLIEENNKRKIK